MRTPPPVFCMQCGPAAVLHPDPGAHVLRCLRCGTEEPLPGYPLFVVTGASGFVGSDRVNIDALLGPLQNNGGPTLTMAPLPGSPAVDAGDKSAG